jgi:ABC-2 type transport system permease protein
MKLIRSEWTKLVTSGSTRLLALTTVVVSAILTAISAPGEGAGSEETTSLYIDTIYLSWIWALVLGVLLVTNEFRHGTAVATFLASPKRSRVVFSKMVVAGVGGFLVHGISLGAAYLTATVVLAATPDTSAPNASALIDALSGLMLVGFTNGMLGVAVGMLIRNQLISLAVLFGWLFLFESIVGAPLAAGAAYLPSALMPRAVSWQWTELDFASLLSFELSPLLAIVLLFVYSIVIAIIAINTTVKKDID